MRKKGLFRSRSSADEAARQATDNFREFFETIDDLFIIGSAEGRIIYTNSAVSRKLGYSPDELVRMHILDLHPGDKREEAGAILAAMFRKERNYCPLELLRKDGSRMPVETRIWQGLWDGKEAIFGISKDLGAEQAALQKFESFFENNPALMAITSLPDQKITQVNTTFIEKLGYRKDELIGHTAAELGLFESPDAKAEITKSVVEWGIFRNTELTVSRKDGSTLSGLFSGALINSQGQSMLVTVMFDISEQVRLRREVENQRQRLEYIIEGTRLGTWEWFIPSGQLICNNRFFEMLGYDPADMTGFSMDSWGELCHPDDFESANALMQRHFRGEIPMYSNEVRLRHKDGSYVWILCRGQATERGADGNVIHVFGTHLDITEKKTFEEKLRDSAIRDPLTNLYNRRHVFEHLEILVAQCMRGKTTIAIAMVDIDHFKQVNDEYGHLAGDFVLREFALAIQKELRPYDLCGRYGGEEFIIVFTNETPESAAAIVQRILESVRAATYEYEGIPIRFTFSSGVSGSGETGAGTLVGDAIIAIADRRMYIAKKSRRNRVVTQG